MAVPLALIAMLYLPADARLTSKVVPKSPATTAKVHSASWPRDLCTIIRAGAGGVSGVVSRLRGNGDCGSENACHAAPRCFDGVAPWLHSAGNALDLANATDNSHGMVIF